MPVLPRRPAYLFINSSMTADRRGRGTSPSRLASGTTLIRRRSTTTNGTAQNQTSNSQLPTIVVTGNVVPSTSGPSDTGVPDLADFAPGALIAAVEKSLAGLTNAQKQAANARAQNNTKSFNYWTAQGYALGGYYYNAGYPSLNSYYSQSGDQICSNPEDCSGP
jgi:hypothetical protein